MIPFLIALALGILKLTGFVALSWWWIALIWPIAPISLALLFGTTWLGLAAWASSAEKGRRRR